MQVSSRCVAYLDVTEFKCFLEEHAEGSVVGQAWITQECPIARYMSQHWGRPNVRVRRTMVYDGVENSRLRVYPMPLWAQCFYDLVAQRPPETPLNREEALQLLDDAVHLVGELEAC